MPFEMQSHDQTKIKGSLFVQGGSATQWCYQGEPYSTSYKAVNLPYSLGFSGGTLEIEKGAIHLVRYGTIEALLRLGDVECL